MSGGLSPSGTLPEFAELYDRLDHAERKLDSHQLSDEERQGILAQRAAQLAKSREQAVVDTVDVVVFKVGGERYALPTRMVDQVLDLREPTSLPGVPTHVLGAIVSRSRVVVVVDLRQLLGLEGGGMSDLSKVIVAAGEESFGLAVEQVEGRMDLPRGEETLPVSGPFLFVTKDQVAVLDLERLADPNQGKSERSE